MLVVGSRRLGLVLVASTSLHSSEFECYDPRFDSDSDSGYCCYLPPLEMSILRSFKASDMFKFNNVYVGSLISKHIPHTIYSNLDVWTETVIN